jgi:type II secretory pathway component PulM
MLAGGWVYRIVLALSGITLVLVVVYLVLVQENRSVQAEVNQRQQFINQSIQLNRINDALIRAIATTAVNDKDDKLRDLLAQNGITINATTGAPVAAPEPPAENVTMPAEKGQ